MAGPRLGRWARAVVRGGDGSGIVCEQRGKWSNGIRFVVVEDDHMFWDEQRTFGEGSSGSHDLDDLLGWFSPKFLQAVDEGL